MPRYYFNVENHGKDTDDQGTELTDPDEARVQAVIFAGEFLKDNPQMIWDGRHFRVVVTDEAKHQLLTINISAEVCSPVEPRAR